MLAHLSALVILQKGISMTSTNIYKPTFLYIKQHIITGKLYFGKTTQNPEKYFGSGVHWKRHINKHGKEHVVNLWYCLFYDEQDCKEFALNFSKQQNIVESKEWLNLHEENGTDGAPVGHPGHIFSEQELKKISISSKKNWNDQTYRENMNEKRKESWTIERKQKQSIKMLNTKRPLHSEIMKQKPLNKKFNRKGLTNSIDHNQKISNALKETPKTEEHKQKLRKPKPLIVTRICDKKLMAIGNFMNWFKNQPPIEMR